MAKEIVEVNGKSVRMGEAAFKIASKHFGASKQRTITKEVPIELRKAPPKLAIIPAVKEPVKEPVNVNVDLTAKEVNVTTVTESARVEPVKAEPTKVAPRKVTRRKSNR
jgi:hypothetical protein